MPFGNHLENYLVLQTYILTPNAIIMWLQLASLSEVLSARYLSTQSIHLPIKAIRYLVGTSYICTYTYIIGNQQ